MTPTRSLGVRVVAAESTSSGRPPGQDWTKTVLNAFTTCAPEGREGERRMQRRSLLHP